MSIQDIIEAIQRECSNLEVLNEQFLDYKENYDFDNAKKWKKMKEITDGTIEKMRLIKIEKEINVSMNKEDRKNNNFMFKLKLELEEEIKEKTLAYQEK